MRDQAVQSVANKLIKRISVYCVACVLAIGAVEGGYAWRHLSEDFDQGLKLIAQSQLPLLAASVWEAEPLVIQRQLVQISQHPSIGYVRLRADIGAVFEVGDTALHNHPNARIFNLAQPYDREISLGTLELAPDPTVLYAEVGRARPVEQSQLIQTLLETNADPQTMGRSHFGMTPDHHEVVLCRTLVGDDPSADMLLEELAELLISSRQWRGRLVARELIVH